MTQEPRRDLSVPLPVKVECPDGSSRHEYAVNVSASGICLHAKAPLTVGDEVRVAFQLPSDPRPIRAVCKVVWTRHDHEPARVARCYETGLCLVEIEACDVERIAWFVSAQVDRR